MINYLRFNDYLTGRMTFGVDFTGEDTAAKIVAELVHASQWFELTPLLNDEWEIKVKEENETLLRNLIKMFYFGIEAPC
jgi:hypothetical protein